MTHSPHFLTSGGNGLADRLYHAHAIPHGCPRFTTRLFSFFLSIKDVLATPPDKPKKSPC